MSRSMRVNHDVTHRVVITIPWQRSDNGDSGAWTHCYGPYSKLGTAKGILAKELASARRFRDNPDSVEGWIERSSVTWERVE